jgi:hypothetical protein
MVRVPLLLLLLVVWEVGFGGPRRWGWRRWGIRDVIFPFLFDSFKLGLSLVR